jgi:hypothetical protein
MRLGLRGARRHRAVLVGGRIRVGRITNWNIGVNFIRVGNRCHAEQDLQLEILPAELLPSRPRGDWRIQPRKLPFCQTRYRYLGQITVVL